MGVAALVLGIVSIVIAWIPLCGVIAFIPALIGLILGIVDTVKKSKKGEKKGMSIAGIILNALAIIFIAVYTFAIGGAVSQGLNELNEAAANEFLTSFNSIITNSLTELE